jgi:hypothetical protein
VVLARLNRGYANFVLRGFSEVRPAPVRWGYPDP